MLISFHLCLLVLLLFLLCYHLDDLLLFFFVFINFSLVLPFIFYICHSCFLFELYLLLPYPLLIHLRLIFYFIQTFEKLNISFELFISLLGLDWVFDVIQGIKILCVFTLLRKFLGIPILILFLDLFLLNLCKGVPFVSSAIFELHIRTLALIFVFFEFRWLLHPKWGHFQGINLYFSTYHLGEGLTICDIFCKELYTNLSHKIKCK